MMTIIRDLTPLNRVFCSSDYDRAIEYLSAILPFKVLEFKAADEYNGWVIPPKWDIKEARILKDGKVILDGSGQPLSLIALSRPFQGRVDLTELKKHLHYDHRRDDVIPYHFRQEYRSWDRDWGFCVTKTFYDNLRPGDYEVFIRTEEDEGVLKILEYNHPGRLHETIVLAAHLDHPGMANDGLSGCAVGLEVMDRLRERKTKFSYKLVLCQEVIGPEYYLGKMDPKERERILEGLTLEMLGTETPLALQASPKEQTNLERVIFWVMKEQGIPCLTGAYGSIVVNGEYIWDAYNIPMASLSRYPYHEYHTDRDNFLIMKEEALEEAAECVLLALADLEKQPVVFKKFHGSPCVSNPQYDLYVDPGQVAFNGAEMDDHTKKLRSLMEMVPTLHRPIGVGILADTLGLEVGPTLEYLKKWADRGLLDLY